MGPRGFCRFRERCPSSSVKRIWLSEVWRRRPDLNRGWRFCRPLPYHLATAPSGRKNGRTWKKLERETGVEPATSTLARSHSTTELLPLVQITKNTVPQPLTPSKTNRTNEGSYWHRYLTSRPKGSHQEHGSFGVYKWLFAPTRNRHHIDQAGYFKGST